MRDGRFEQLYIHVMDECLVSSRTLSVLVALLLVSGCLGDSDSDGGVNESTPTSGTSDTNSTGSSIPTTPSSQTCLTAPVFEIETLNRTGIESTHTNDIGLFNLQVHRGKTIILDFTAADAASGKLVHYALKERLDDFSSNVLIVSIGVWGEPLDYLNETFGQGDSELPWIVGAAGNIERNLTYLYNTFAIPRVYVIDYGGYLVHSTNTSTPTDNWTGLEQAVESSEKRNTLVLRQQYLPTPTRYPCYIPSPDQDGLLIGPDVSPDYCFIPALGGNISITTDSDGDGLTDCWEWEVGLDPYDPGTVAGKFETENETSPNPDNETSPNPDNGPDGDPDRDGLTNSQEVANRTDPMLADTDGDGLSDGWEVRYFLDPLVPDSADADLDGDGLSNLQEEMCNTNPLSNDTDLDGLTDSFEILNGPGDMAWCSEDMDGDGKLNGPGDWDTDGDGMSDGYETLYGDLLDPTNASDSYGDQDQDGLDNIEESRINTHPNSSDSDGDGMPDGWEFDNGLNATSTMSPNGGDDDPDGDGLTNLEEYLADTNPQEGDTDSDGVNDASDNHPNDSTRS